MKKIVEKIVLFCMLIKLYSLDPQPAQQGILHKFDLFLCLCIFGSLTSKDAERMISIEHLAYEEMYFCDIKSYLDDTLMNYIGLLRCYLFAIDLL